MMYTNFKNDSVLKIQPDWGEVPANWSVYFTVSDWNASGSKI
jgi:hypothetical protein